MCGYLQLCTWGRMVSIFYTASCVWNPTSLHEFQDHTIHALLHFAWMPGLNNFLPTNLGFPN